MKKTLRKKAYAVGIQLNKGFSHYLCGGAVVEYGGERMTGYNAVDLSTGLSIWGSFDYVRDHVWQLEDVEEYLKEVYEDAGLKF